MAIVTSAPAGYLVDPISPILGTAYSVTMMFTRHITCRTVFLFSISTAAAGAQGQSGQGPPCDVLEVTGGNPRYNVLVCAGIRALEENRVSVAVDTLLKAAALPLFENPNFRLFPRLSLAYFRMGDSAQAPAYLERSRLALHVLVGIYHCQEHDTGFTLVDSSLDSVVSPYAQEITGTMCGAAYEHMYRRESLESVITDARHVQNYLTIRDLVIDR